MNLQFYFYFSVLPNDSVILEDFIKTIIEKDSKPHFLGWCSFHAAEKLWFELMVSGLTVMVFLILIPLYYKIIKHVLQNKYHVRSRKLIVTTIFLLGAFLFCRVPFVLFEVSMVVLIRFGHINFHGNHGSVLEVNNFLNTLLMFFPLLDPVIYSIRYVYSFFFQTYINFSIFTRQNASRSPILYLAIGEAFSIVVTIMLWQENAPSVGYETIFKLR